MQRAPAASAGGPAAAGASSPRDVNGTFRDFDLTETVELGGQRLELGDIAAGEVAFAGPVELTEDQWILGARLDPNNDLNECREDNGADLGPWPCD